MFIVAILGSLLVLNCVHCKSIAGECPVDEFACDGASCIQKDQVCDTDSNCKDGTDEKGCDCLISGQLACGVMGECLSFEDYCLNDKPCPQMKGTVDCRHYISTTFAYDDTDTTPIPMTDTTPIPMTDTTPIPMTDTTPIPMTDTPVINIMLDSNGFINSISPSDITHAHPGMVHEEDETTQKVPEIEKKTSCKQLNLLSCDGTSETCISKDDLCTGQQSCSALDKNEICLTGRSLTFEETPDEEVSVLQLHSGDSIQFEVKEIDEAALSNDESTDNEGGYGVELTAQTNIDDYLASIITENYSADDMLAKNQKSKEGNATNDSTTAESLLNDEQTTEAPIEEVVMAHDAIEIETKIENIMFNEEPVEPTTPMPDNKITVTEIEMSHEEHSNAEDIQGTEMPNEEEISTTAEPELDIMKMSHEGDDPHHEAEMFEEGNSTSDHNHEMIITHENMTMGESEMNHTESSGNEASEVELINVSHISNEAGNSVPGVKQSLKREESAPKVGFYKNMKIYIPLIVIGLLVIVSMLAWVTLRNKKRVDSYAIH